MLTPGDRVRALERYIVAASCRERPRVLFVGTASGDDPGRIAAFYETYGGLGCAPSHLPFFRRTPADLRALILEQDIVHVGGGNTRSMLAVWRDWKFDIVLREAYDRGVVLCGSSAGSICWFAEGVTDSVDGDLTRMAGLGFLSGSNCPHYDAEADRRPAYRRLVGAREMGAGYAADDGVGLHFVDGALSAVVSARASAAAYRVEPDGETARETRLEPRAL